jgi:Na+/phosphate symporter
MFRRVLLICISLFLVVLSLELIKAGTANLAELGHGLTSRGLPACLGVGWLLACVLCSGSPVAAIALALLAARTLTEIESFAMIIGSRLGASFVVLAVGLLYDLRTRGQRGGVYVGTLAFLTTASVYVPGLGLGYLLLRYDCLAGLRFEPPVFFKDGVSAVFDPIVDLAREACTAIGFPLWSLTILGIICLMIAFKIFDLTLPQTDPLGGRVGQLSTTIFRPSVAFLIGMLVTCVTLSVSLSLTLLVPLTVRGLIRRENLIPYILGANITTFVDTLVVAFLVNHPAAFSIVLCAVVVVTLISLPIVFLFYHPYERLLDTTATAICARKRFLVLLVALILLVPLLLAFM